MKKDIGFALQKLIKTDSMLPDLEQAFNFDKVILADAPSNPYMPINIHTYANEMRNVYGRNFPKKDDPYTKSQIAKKFLEETYLAAVFLDPNPAQLDERQDDGINLKPVLLKDPS